MRTASTTPHHAGWRPRLGAILEAGAAIRTLVARLVIGRGIISRTIDRLDRVVISPSLRPPRFPAVTGDRYHAPGPHREI